LNAVPRTLHQAVDQAPLNGTYWLQFWVLALCTIVDFFDYFIAGFLVSVVAPLWQMTFGQSAVVLMAAGVGGMVGSLLGGYLADQYGRKRVIVSCAILCGISAGLVAFLPERAWELFAVLRFLTGVFISCVYAATVAMVTEMTPTRHRTVVASLNFVAPSAGILVATLSSATLLHWLGWRGVAALAALPALIGLVCVFLLNESILWLISKGRDAEASRIAERRLGISVDGLSIERPAAHQLGGSYAELLKHHTGRAALIFFVWFGIASAVYGVYAWGPTIVSMARGISTQEAARLFLWVSIAAVAGKITFSLLSRWLGRRPTGLITGTMGVILLVIAAATHSVELLGFPAFLLFIAIGEFFTEGGAAQISPYSAELFPVRLAGRGAGIGQFGNGVGKIIGPLGLAIAAGTSNIVAPKATADAILPGLLFLAACLMTTVLAYVFLGVETRDQQLDVDR